ncbi:MAG: tetratricopeptide repeat protein [Tepidisphaeraceae bacterium]|jgi:tetratricopeptide (TPR) repeat protein
MPGLPDVKSLWDYRDPAATERRFRDLLPQSASDPAYHVELLSQIARTHSLRGNFTEAHALLDQAESLLKPDMHRPGVCCLLERGRTYNSDGNPQAALPLFQSAYRLATEHHFDFLAVDAAHMIAIAHPDPAEQLRWNLQTIDLVESCADLTLRSWLGPLCNNAGWTYHDQGDYPRSLALLQKAQVYHDQFGDAKAKFIARWSVAKLLRLNDRRGEALEIQQLLESDMTAGNDPDGFVYEELGELYLLQNRHDVAREYFRKAYPLLEKVDWLVQSELARVERIRKLADLQPPSASAR